MRRTILLAVATLAVAACSSSAGKPAAVGTTLPTSVASTATPAAPSTSDVKNQILLCGGFDIGAVYINDAWPSLMEGHPKLGYGISLDKAVDTWQQMLSSAPHGDIYDAIAGTRKDVQALADGIRTGDSSKGPIDVSGPVANIRTDYKYVQVACDHVGYTLSEPLKDK